MLQSLQSRIVRGKNVFVYGKNCGVTAMAFLRHRCQGQKCANFVRCSNWQRIEIKCVINVEDNQAGKINWICVKEYYIL